MYLKVVFWGSGVWIGFEEWIDFNSRFGNEDNLGWRNGIDEDIKVRNYRLFLEMEYNLFFR